MKYLLFGELLELSMKLLFICSEGKNRSQTAAEMYAGNHEVESFGLFSSIIVNVQPQLDWADKIFVMEQQHKNYIEANYPDLEKEIICLDIPDVFMKNEKSLIDLIRSRVTPHLKK